MGRQRVRARLRRAAAAWRARGRPARPAPGVPGRARRVRRRLAAWRPGQLRCPAHHRPAGQGHGGGLHRPGRAVHHHHHVRRGTGQEPGAEHLLGVRRGRLFAGPGAVRAAHRDQLAVDAAAARADRGGDPGRRAAADPAHRPVAPRAPRCHGRRPGAHKPRRRPPRPARIRPARRGHGDHGHAAAGLRGGQRATGRLGVAPDPGFFRNRHRTARRLHRGRAAQPRSPAPAGHLPVRRADPREPRRHGAVRLVRLVPVPGHPVPADHGRMVGAGHRAGLPAGRVLVAASSPRMGSVLDRFGPARVVAAGFACLAAGYTLFLRVGRRRTTRR